MTTDPNLDHYVNALNHDEALEALRDTVAELLDMKGCVDAQRLAGLIAGQWRGINRAFTTLNQIIEGLGLSGLNDTDLLAALKQSKYRYSFFIEDESLT